MKKQYRSRGCLRLVAGALLLATVAQAHADSGGKKGHHDNKHKQMKMDYSDVEEHAFGRASDPNEAAKTITVEMTDDLKFTPTTIRVKRGDTVRFVVRNKGQMLHEMVLGTDQSLTQHAAMMKKFPGMEHDEPHMAHVDPGHSHKMGWQFTNAGTYAFGCLVPGHYEGGMKGTIVVE